MLFQFSKRVTPNYWATTDRYPCYVAPTKILERVVYNELYRYCSINNLLSPKNSGFKKGDGAINQLLHITDKMYKGFDDSKETAVIFLDICKAFDKVWIQGLFFKLQRIGLRDSCIEWFKSYLTGRNQKVVLFGVSSDTLFLNAGVPQGSILGSLLFLIFIDDIDKNICSDMSLFADDSSLIKTYNNMQEAESCLNQDLCVIDQWSRDWLVQFTRAKLFS